MNVARRLVIQAERAGIAPSALAARVALSAVRRRLPPWRDAIVSIDALGTRIHADLRLPFGLSLYRYGFPEPEARVLGSLLQPGDVFVDGGAHVGIFTLLAAALVGETGRVVSCEPVPENMRLLKANVALNKFHWVETHMAALGACAGTAELHAFGAGSALASFAPETMTGSRRLMVNVQTLDEVAGHFGTRVRLVKLDVEGAEVLAVRGASSLLKAKPDFLVELEPEHLARQNATVDELEQCFSAYGFRGYEIRENNSGIVYVPMASWRRPIGSPNILVSARGDVG